MICPYCGSIVQAEATACICGSAVEKVPVEGRFPGMFAALEEQLASNPRYMPPYAPVSHFSFPSFARAIFHDRAFMLPALYGGELEQGDNAFEALFVLQDPSKGFTERRWKPCATPEQAIEQHRSIFLEWAYKDGSNQAILFKSFSPTDAEFFRRFYVTDCWKDGTFKSRYWRLKLRIELHEVHALRVIVVGEKAWMAVMSALKGSPIPTPIFSIIAPWKKGMTPQEYETHVSDLWAKINGGSTL